MNVVRVHNGQQAPSWVPLPWLLAGVSVAYYIGSLLGMQLRLPPATPSILWPPNAILASALLLADPRRWPIVLLAAIPAHLVVELQTGWPPLLVLSLFLTNCLEATIAAGGVRLLSDAPWRFDTPRRLIALIVAAGIAAPLVSSFADAAAVRWFRNEPYWEVWRHRLLANILAELIIVPAIVGVVTSVGRSAGTRSLRRTAEAAALGIGFITTGLFALSTGLDPNSPLRAASLRTPLALQLPFLLWAAVRFGPTGASVALLSTSVMTAWAVVHGQGPFEAIDPATTIPAVTMSLIVVATTLMSLATLVDERRQTHTAIRSRLRFEELLSRMGRTFIQLPSGAMDRAFSASLGQVGSFFAVDRAFLVAASGSADGASLVASWTNPSGPRQPDATQGDTQTLERFLSSARSPLMSSDAMRPLDAAVDSTTLAALGLQSGIVAPLMAGDRPLGALVLGSATQVAWSDQALANVRILAEVLANALARKISEDALRASELMKSSILRSLTSGVVVVDRSGLVLAINESWSRLAQQSGCVQIHVGANLFELYRTAAGHGNGVAAALATGVAAVAEGTQDVFVFEHAFDTGRGRRWWSVLIVPLNRPERGVVVTRADISDLRRAELEAQRSRQELAHVTRVATVGELTASLAHQLNQPLTAIMTNAHAARRMLDAETPDLTEVRQILLDIAKDDRRASDIIQRVRDLLQKGGLEMTRVDLSRAIRDVTELMSSDALIRGVTILLDFECEPVFVRGDRVQLQQVILNLLHNGLEAMSGQDDRSHTITVRCRSSADAVEVSVKDSGPGLGDGVEEVVFEPFYSTKDGGMGMGLPIARSIVEAHGGAIYVEHDAHEGATFAFTLPPAA